MRAPAALDAFADSSAVFLGTVTQVRNPQPSLHMQSSFPFITYDTPAYAALTVTVAVSQTWRGPAYRTLTLTTGRSYSGCGFPFQVGSEYLVYAYYNSVGSLITHRCSRTNTASNARADLALFGTGQAPHTDAPDTYQPIVLGISCMGTLLLAAGIGIGILKRSR